MRRILAWVLALGLLTGSGAAWTDTEGHWAEEALERAEGRGWITGYEDGTVRPDASLTWGHYLTVLGRAFWPDALAEAAPGGHWAAPALAAAEERGIPGAGAADPDAPLTRQAAAALLWAAAGSLGLAEGEEESPAYADWAEVPEDCRAGAAGLTALGVLTGYGDGTFRGEAPLTRAEGAVLLERLEGALAALPPQEDTGTERPAESEPAPAETGETAAPEPETSALRQLGENDDKLLRIFGTAERRRYDSEAEARAHMTEVTVPVWKLDRATGIKTTGHIAFSINQALAEDMTAIFTAIWADGEQFPIYEIGGYDWRGDTAKGEHNCGTAVDLNARENYQVYADGLVGAGEYWKPGEDPWSIPAGGSVVRIFRAYGYTWGGDAWPTNRDYMHFSYLGV